MNGQHFHHTIIKAAGYVLLSSVCIAQAETGNPHLLSKEIKSISCTGCHQADPLFKTEGLLETKNSRINLASFSKDGTALCTDCHSADDGHKVGLELDFQVPADLPLDNKNKMTCLTCHYTHGSLTSDRPQASFSFMDRLFDAERLHKSFLLRRNNADGELCLICHNVSEGSK